MRIHIIWLAGVCREERGRGGGGEILTVLSFFWAAFKKTFEIVKGVFCQKRKKRKGEGGVARREATKLTSRRTMAALIRLQQCFQGTVGGNKALLSRFARPVSQNP